MTTPKLIAKIEKSLIENGQTEKSVKKYMSDKSGIVISAFYKWQSNTEMKFSTAVDLCNALGLNLSKLLNEK